MVSDWSFVWSGTAPELNSAYFLGFCSRILVGKYFTAGWGSAVKMAWHKTNEYCITNKLKESITI